MRTLYGLLRERREAEQVEFGFLAEALTRAFTAEPVPFEESWRGIVEPYYEEDFPEPQSAWTALERTLLYHIADLRRMSEAGMLPADFMSGVRSPTGDHWYNTDVSTYLEAASAGMSAKSDEIRERHGGPRTPSGATWRYLTYLLEIGHWYE